MAKKRSGEWLGGAKLITPAPDVSTTTAEIIALIEPIGVGDSVGVRTRFNIEAIYAHFSIRRLGIAEVEAMGFMVYQIQPSEASSLPLAALDALSTTARAYSNKAIMMMAPLPIPPFLASSDLATAIPSDEVMVVHHEFQANRKHDRANQVLCMAVNAETDLEVSVFVQWRIWVTY